LGRVRVNAEKNDFKNDGPFQFMKLVIDEQFVPGEGKQVYNGVLTKDLDKPVPSQQEQLALREEAKKNLVNIGKDERERRRKIGQIGYGITLVAAAALIYFPVPAFARLGIYFPLALAQGFIASANEGL